MSVFKLLVLTFVSVILTSCTWIKLTPEGENVAELTPSDVTNCQRTGTTTVEVLDKVLLNRSKVKVEQELRTLARNRAAGRGNAIVAGSGINGGEQMFVIYSCPI